MRRERGCAGLSRGAGVEWDVTGISQCLSRNENDFLCHMLSFLTLSLCAFSLVHLLGIIPRCVFHLSLSSWILLAALLYKNLNKFGVFFPEKCKNSRRKCVCALWDTVPGFPSCPWTYRCCGLTRICSGQLEWIPRTIIAIKSLAKI